MDKKINHKFIVEKSMQKSNFGTTDLKNQMDFLIGMRIGKK